MARCGRRPRGKCAHWSIRKATPWRRATRWPNSPPTRVTFGRRCARCTWWARRRTWKTCSGSRGPCRGCRKGWSGRRRSRRRRFKRAESDPHGGLNVFAPHDENAVYPVGRIHGQPSRKRSSTRSTQWRKPRHSCDSNIRARRHTRVRGLLKKYLLACSFLVFLFQARTSQMAFIVLNTAKWAAGRLPVDWQIKMNHGQPDISICKETESCLRLKSVMSSFGLEHSVDVDPAQMPFLTWHWKVAQLPGGGDFRRASTDDQAAQVLVAFSDKRILTYI